MKKIVRYITARGNDLNGCRSRHHSDGENVLLFRGI